MKNFYIEIREDEILELLKPWLIREYSNKQIRWQIIKAKETKRMLKKRYAQSIGQIFSRKSTNSTKTHRTPNYVNQRYSETWNKYRLLDPGDVDDSTKTIFLEWGGRGYVAQPLAAHRCHLLGLSRALDRLGSSTVLEVGAGPGITLFALSSIHPEIDFTGVELTGAGVQAAVSLQKAPLPEAIDCIAPAAVKSRTAHQRISFNQGDAQALPFADQSFDLVITRQAIEQMEQIHPRVFAEIHRVARRHAIFVEPLPDFNRTLLQKIGTGTKNYITVESAKLRNHGFEPIFQFDDWPHKITNGVGMVVCRKLVEAGLEGAGTRFRAELSA